MTVPVPLFSRTSLGSALKHVYIHTQSISAAHKVVLTSYNIGGVGGWNVDLAYYPSIMLHTAKYRCKNSTQESPIPMKQHRTACCWPSVSDESGSCEIHFTGATKRPNTRTWGLRCMQNPSPQFPLRMLRDRKKNKETEKQWTENEDSHTGLLKSENSWSCARGQTWQIWLEKKNRWGPLLS